MLGNHRRKIEQLSHKLQQLQVSPDDMNLLRELQNEILNSLRRTENRILRLRKEYGEAKKFLKTQRLPKEDSAKLKESIDGIHQRIKRHQWMLNLWRTFGDGIAFTYLDKWSLKPMMYEVASPAEKNRPGSIQGKPGLRVELALLRQLLSAGIPALLSDLTNCIRHGDICILVGPNPLPIEVKSSKNQNARTARQLENLKAIVEYLETDKAANVRGASELLRIALPSQEIEFRHLFDEGIESAVRDGYFIADPEPGLRFAAFTTNQAAAIERLSDGFSPSALYFLNDAKNADGCGVYYPFTLSIKSPKNLVRFLSGQVVLMVMLDFQTLIKVARKHRLLLSITDEVNWPLQVEWRPKGASEPAINKISSHFLMRMIIELLSWDWLFRVERKWSHQIYSRFRAKGEA
jgi:hypothetical protein